MLKGNPRVAANPVPAKIWGRKSEPNSFCSAAARETAAPANWMLRLFSRASATASERVRWRTPAGEVKVAVSGGA